MAKHKIGIIGSGDVAKALGRGFVGLGCETKLGSREPQKLEGWAKEMGGKASAGTFAETAKHGDIVVIATLWTGTKSALELASVDNFRGKVVIDATNPLDFSSGGPQLALGHTDSGGEQVQRWLPGAKVVKAFNSVGNAHMVNPQFPGGPPDMFIAGDDAAAKETVAQICRDFGWGVIDAGGLDGARLLEPLCILWVKHAILSGNKWNHAFKMLHK